MKLVTNLISILKISNDWSKLVQYLCIVDSDPSGGSSEEGKDDIVEAKTEKSIADEFLVLSSRKMEHPLPFRIIF